MTDEPAYICTGCEDRWPRAKTMGNALAAARNHACPSADGEVRFDPGYDADDYDVEFEEGSA